MKIKYGEIDLYMNWLIDNLALAGKKSRMRVRFVEILAAKKDEFEKHRLALIKEHSHLDENGNIKILKPDENGSGEADIIDRVAFNNDLRELVQEEFVIEESETNKEMLLMLKKCIEDCPTEWQGQDCLKYELVCKLFDGIYEDDK